MGPPHRQTKFQHSWASSFSWVKPSDDCYNAKCTLCKSTFSIQSMGRQALVSHERCKKHQEQLRNKEKTTPLYSFFKQTDQTQPSSELSPASHFELTTQPTSEICKETFSHKQLTLSERYTAKEGVTKAEILWCLQSVMKHQSLREAASCVSLFKLMFPTCEIANNMNLQKSKISYLIVYGLGHYFQTELQRILRSCSEFVVGFDESLNKIAQKQQMDLSIRYWDEQSQQVNTRYFTSVFLNHTTAEDLKEGLKDALLNLGWTTMIQLSMDGPNVNFKTLRLLKEERESDVDSPQLLDLGSCGLHTVHCAFKAGVNATSWGIIQFLRALYNLFKDVPARRGDYTAKTKSDIFPLKFCSIRWLENVAVANRALVMLSNLKKYVELSKESKKEPTCKSYFTVKEALKDNLLSVKLTFFKAIAEELQPFLTEFQTSKPMTPFLYDELQRLLKCFGNKFLKKDVLENKDIQKLDLKDENNLLPTKDIDLGYSTRLSIRKCKEGCTILDSEIKKCRVQCNEFYRTMVTKLLVRSPIKYALTKSLRCIDPNVAATPSGLNTLKVLLETMVEKNHLSGNMAEKVEYEYRQFCSVPRVKLEMEQYSRFSKRLDNFWMELLGGGAQYDNLRILLKKIFILSHGNADLERGFSINKECLVANLEAESLIAQRIVFDSVAAAGGVHNIVINTAMIQSARNAHSRYKEAQEKKKKEEHEQKQKADLKRRIREQEKELKGKKQKLLEKAENEAAAIDEQLKLLKQ